MREVLASRRARAQAVIATMWRELVAFAAAESVIHAETGSWSHQQNISSRYFDWSRFNRGGNVVREFSMTVPSDDPERDGWWFTIANTQADVICTIVVGKAETVFPGARDGKPFCRTWNVAGVINQPDPYPRPIRLNTPPPMPWHPDVHCVGKGCAFEELAACTDVIVTRDRKPGSEPLFTWRKREQRPAGGESIQVQSAGMVVIRRATSTAVRRNADGLDSLHFTSADTVYTLAEAEDGSYDFWYHRKLWRGDRFWGLHRNHRSDSAVQVRAEKIWWPVRVHNTYLEFGYLDPRPGIVSGMHPSEGDSMSGCADPVWVTSTERFAFYSDPWLDLHQFLHEWARIDKDLTGRGEWRMDERLEKRLSEAERVRWDTALAFYRDFIASRDGHDPLMVREAKGLIRLKGKLGAIPPDEIPGIRAALTTAMPVFLHWWWPGHNYRNHRMIQGDALWFRVHEKAFVEMAERVFGVTWPRSLVRVEEVFYSNVQGGYTDDTPVVGFLNDPEDYVVSAQERLFRAALTHSSVAAKPRAAMARAFRQAGVPEPVHLWDAIAFTTVREFLRPFLKANEIPDAATWFTVAFPDSPDWEHVAMSVEYVWPAVVRGEMSREDGYVALVRRFRP